MIEVNDEEQLIIKFIFDCFIGDGHTLSKSEQAFYDRLDVDYVIKRDGIIMIKDLRR